MNCISLCWTQDTTTDPPLGNTLLADPSISANEHKWNALTYEFIHLIAIAAFVALSIGVLTWVIFFAAEYQATTLLASTFLFSVTYPICFHPYRIDAQIYWRLEAFENQVGKQIETITAEYNRRETQGSEYLLELHRKIGAGRLPQDIEQRIMKTTQKVSAYESLIPLYARAIAYNEESEKVLTRLNILILTPPRPTDQQKLENLNYKELLERLQVAPSNERSAIIQKITLCMAEWHKLEENYLALRMTAAQVATIASNPIQKGEAIGTINPSDATTEALWLKYADFDPYFFTYNTRSTNDGPIGISRAKLMSIHADTLSKVLTERNETGDLEAPQNSLLSKGLLCSPEIRDAVQTKVSHAIRKILQKHNAA